MKTQPRFLDYNPTGNSDKSLWNGGKEGHLPSGRLKLWTRTFRVYYINEEMGSRKKKRTEWKRYGTKETKNSLRIQVIYSRGIHLVICQDDTNLHGSHEISCENLRARAYMQARTSKRVHNRIQYEYNKIFLYFFITHYSNGSRLNICGYTRMSGHVSEWEISEEN